MSFPVPSFPTQCNIWLSPNLPSGGGAPDFTAVNSFLYLSPQNLFFYQVRSGAATQPFNDQAVLVKLPFSFGALAPLTIFEFNPGFAMYFKMLNCLPYYLGTPQAFWGFTSYRCNPDGTRFYAW